MARTKFQLEDMHRIKAALDLQWTADGRYAFYVLQKTDLKQEKNLTDLWQLDLVSGQERPLTSSGNNRLPRLSPDATKLAFLSTRQDHGSRIYILDLTAGGEARCLPTVEAVEDFIWTPDGQSIVYTAAVFPFDEDWTPYAGAPAKDGIRLKEATKLAASGEKDKREKSEINSVKVITRFHYRMDGVGYYGQARTHHFMIPAQLNTTGDAKPTARQLTFGDWDHPLGRISPCGRWLCVSGCHCQDPEIEHRDDLWLYPISGGEPVLLYRAVGPSKVLSWSPDGRFIAFAGHNNTWFVSSRTDVNLLPVASFLQQLAAGSTPEALTCQNVLNLTAEYDRPYGAGGGPEPRLAGGRTSMWRQNEFCFMLGDQGAGTLYHSIEGHTECLWRQEQCSLLSFAVSDLGFLLLITSPDQLAEWFWLRQGELRQVTHHNDALMAEREFAHWQARSFVSAEDGQPLQGWLYYPAQFDQSKKYPLFHLVHGGPHGVYGPAFEIAAQYFAAQGYFVLLINPRGSTTFGEEFSRAIDQNWGDRDYADLLSGLDDALATGFIDPDLCFMHGWSYGGYMACWLATQTKRYKAICGGAVVSSLALDYGLADNTMANEYEYGGQPWQGKDSQLIKSSPLTYAEQVETPLLLLHGESDLRCGITNSEVFYQALKRLGKEVVMVRYPGEYHGFKRPLHQLDRYERIFAWFEYYKNKKK